MYMIIQKKDKKKMAGMVEDILYTAGELMHCVEEMRDEDGYNDRYYGDRYGMGMRDGGRYGNRDWDDDMMMERRRYRRY
jgi:hypothetical protein